MRHRSRRAPLLDDISWLPPKVRNAIKRELGRSPLEEDAGITMALTLTHRALINERKARMRRNGDRPHGGIHEAAIEEIARTPTAPLRGPSQPPPRWVTSNVRLQSYASRLRQPATLAATKPKAMVTMSGSPWGNALKPPSLAVVGSNGCWTHGSIQIGRCCRNLASTGTDGRARQDRRCQARNRAPPRANGDGGQGRGRIASALEGRAHPVSRACRSQPLNGV